MKIKEMVSVVFPTLGVLTGSVFLFSALGADCTSEAPASNGAAPGTPAVERVTAHGALAQPANAPSAQTAPAACDAACSDRNT